MDEGCSIFSVCVYFLKRCIFNCVSYFVLYNNISYVVYFHVCVLLFIERVILKPLYISSVCLLSKIDPVNGFTTPDFRFNWPVLNRY